MANKLDQSALIDKVALDAGITKAASTKAVASVFSSLKEAVKDGGAGIKNFGSFKLKETKARLGRNPKTGVPVNVPAKVKVVFVPAKDFLGDK